MKKNYLFELQLFAGENNPALNTQTTALADASTPNDLSSTMKTFYRTNLLENARSEHYFSQFDRKYRFQRTQETSLNGESLTHSRRLLLPLLRV